MNNNIKKKKNHHFVALYALYKIVSYREIKIVLLKQFFPSSIPFLKREKKKSSNIIVENNYFLLQSIDHWKHPIKLWQHLKRQFYFTPTILEGGWRARARVRKVDNGKDFIQKRHMSRQRYAQVAIHPTQFSLPAPAFERNTTPSLPLSAGCIFKSYHDTAVYRAVGRCTHTYPGRKSRENSVYLRDMQFE